MPNIRTISTTFRSLQCSVILMLVAVLLVSCASSDVAKATKTRADLCERDGGQIIHGQVSNGGLSILYLPSFTPVLGINSIDHPLLVSMLNPDGLSIKEDELLKLAEPYRNLDESGKYLLNGRLDYFDLYIIPASAFALHRSIIPIDQPKGVYRFRLSNLSDDRCAPFKQRASKISKLAASKDPEMAALYDLYHRGQCYYADYLGNFENYQLARYLYYRYDIADDVLNMTKSVKIIYDRADNKILAREIGYSYRKIRGRGIWGKGCGKKYIDRYPHPSIFHAVGILE